MIFRFQKRSQSAEDRSASSGPQHGLRETAPGPDLGPSEAVCSGGTRLNALGTHFPNVNRGPITHFCLTGLLWRLPGMTPEAGKRAEPSTDARSSDSGPTNTPHRTGRRRDPGGHF